MTSMMLHCGASEVTRAQVEAVPIPTPTRTWHPLAYGQSISFLHDQAERVLGLKVANERYGLNQDGKQMFALLTLDTGSDETALALGLRNSYNKTLKNCCAGGQSVFVCDNLCISGSSFMVMRKNTKNVWRDFRNMITAQIRGALKNYEQVQRDTARMKATPCHEQRGYSILGVAVGNGLLTPTQASVAFGDWRKPRHEAFAERNLWSLYNAVTEGLKKGSAARMLDRHAAAHDFFSERLAS